MKIMIFMCSVTAAISAYVLNVLIFRFVDAYDNPQHEQPAETKTAEQGSTVIMDCKTDLNGPVSYQWSKPGGVLPREVDPQSVSNTLFIFKCSLL